MSIWTGAFWKAAVERAAKTFAQTLAALLVIDPVLGVLDIDWGQAFSVAGLAAAVSLLTSIGSDAITQGAGPSLTDAETLTSPVSEA